MRVNWYAVRLAVGLGLAYYLPGTSLKCSCPGQFLHEQVCMHKCMASGVKLNVFSMHQGMLLLTGKEEEVRPLTHKWVTITGGTMHSPSQ